MALPQPHHIHCSPVALPSLGVAGPEFSRFLHGRGRCTSEVRLTAIYMGIFCMKARTRLKRRSTERSTGFQSRRHLGVSVICTTVGASKALAARAPSLSAVPGIGLGTCCLKGQDSFQQVLNGLQLGYRFIDTASHYDNESDVAQAVRESQVQREDVFLVTKIWFDDMGEKAPEAILESLKRLDTEYVDLLLMHFPGANDALQSPSANRKRRETTWRAMEEAKSSGRAKSIGVANFTRRHLKEMFEYCREPPSVLQTEIHPYFQQTKLVEFAVQKGLQVQSFSPLAHGELNLLEDKVLKSIAATHQKSTAQVVLRWLLQKSILPIVFSRSRQRLAENLDTNFQLSSGDMDRISFLDRDMAEARVGFDPNLIA